MRVDFRDRRAASWQLFAGALLAVLLVTLAVLQYRWLGEVAEAERARMRAGLQARAADFTQEFDRELTRIYLAFHFEPEAFDRDPGGAVAGGYDKARPDATVPGLIKDVFLLEAQGSQGSVLRRFDPAARTLQPSEWPPALADWRDRASAAARFGPPGGLPIFMADAVDASAPALIVPVPFVRKIDDGAGHLAIVPLPGAAARSLIVWLDADRLRQRLLEPLVAKYFGADAASEYLVSIVRRGQPAHVVYATTSDTIDEGSADVSAGLFDLRLDELTHVAGPGAARSPQEPGFATDRVAITIVRRSPGASDASRLLLSGGPRQGAWQLRARYRIGSLETIVARSRRRNMAITLGVLGLLGAAFALMIAASQRQRKLARQQMEFVASVSHELRTPLAVICSAGENLADGVVADGAQVKTYGSLIEAEGRRLGDMVERVLRFAGINAGQQTQVRAEVNLTQVITAAAQAVAGDARERGVVLTVQPHVPLPATMGDVEALRSAVQNVVGNAVKYSAAGGAVEITADEVSAGVVRIRVVDFGIGIDEADLPQIFKPFFRGRRAVEAQVRGSGIGLSVVKHVIQSHGGDVRVESRAGEGTTVTIVLPIVSPADPGAAAVVRLRPGAAS